MNHKTKGPGVGDGEIPGTAENGTAAVMVLDIKTGN